MFIAQKHISRRTVLKGMGVTLGLPLLDAMIPAGTAWAKTAEGAAAARPRLIAIEMVHGSAGSAQLGIKKNMWSPAAVGRSFDLSPTSLSPLEPYRDYLTIVSGTSDHSAEAWSAPEVGGDHFRSSATFLTQMHPKQTEGSDIHAGTSIDQIYAKHFGQDTAIPSMQLCIEPVDQSGGCAYGYACVYTDTISWASPSEPLPMIRDPRAVFDQLFGAGATPAERVARRQANASILDWINERVGQLNRELGPRDRQRLDAYLTDVREIERRIQNVEAHNASGEPRDLPDAPVGVPDSFSEHVHLMSDLMAAAFQANLTRIFSFKMGRDGSSRVYAESGTDKPFHPASHHGGTEKGVKDFHLINKYHVSMLPYFLDRLKSIQEEDGNMLDKTLIMYGSPMGDSNLHNHRRCPLVLLGGANGKLHGEMHIKALDGTPMANAMLSVMHTLGMDDMKSLGDSTDALPLAINA